MVKDYKFPLSKKAHLSRSKKQDHGNLGKVSTPNLDALVAIAKNRGQEVVEKYNTRIYEEHTTPILEVENIATIVVGTPLFSKILEVENMATIISLLFDVC